MRRVERSQTATGKLRDDRRPVQQLKLITPSRQQSREDR